jgi:enolase
LYDTAFNAGGSVLPVPMMNILNGGAHADSSVDFQEFMVMPLAAPSFREALRTGAEIFHAARHPEEEGHSTGVGDEGVLPRASPPIARRWTSSSRRSRRRATRRARRSLALDVASSELWDDKAHHYEFRSRVEKARTADEMVALYQDWVRQYPIVSIEDGLAEGDWDGWKT